MDASFRVLALATSALLCAVLAGLLALYTHGKSLPPSDGAYGLSVWDSLGDPVVLTVWLGLVLAGAAAGFACSLWLLWRVALSKAAPTVAVVSIAAAAVSAPVVTGLSSVVGLIAGIVSMFWCRRQEHWTRRSLP